MVGDHAVSTLIRDRISAHSSPGRRTDDQRLALVVEGGGMRGAITGGMVLGLYERGALPAFDMVYGASAGALNAAWLVSGDPRPGLEAWWDPALHRATMRVGNLARRRPIVDARHLVEVVYERVVPLDTDAVLASTVGLHPMATDVETGRAVDLHPVMRDKRTLQLALRASTCLPMLGGAPVVLDGRRYLDAGIAEAVPVASAIRGGATHVLVLRSRVAGDVATGMSLTDRLVARYLRRFSPELAATWRERPLRAMQAERRLREVGDGEGGKRPALLVVRPPAGTPAVARLERDAGRIRAGFDGGMHAVGAAISTATRATNARSA